MRPVLLVGVVGEGGERGTGVTVNTLFYPGVFNDVPGIRQTQQQFYLLVLYMVSMYLSRRDLDKRRAVCVHFKCTYVLYACVWCVRVYYECI